MPVAETAAQQSPGQARQQLTPTGVLSWPLKLLRGLGCENAQGCALKWRGVEMPHATTWLDQYRLREIPIIER